MSASSTWHPSRGPREPDGPSGPADQEPETRRRSRRLGRWSLVAFILALVLAAGWWVSTSPIFHLKSLRVTGNSHVREEEVRRLSGLDGRTNVLWLSAGAVILRLERDPWILSAELMRRLPSTITITVRERVPVAVLTVRPPLLVAADGTVLGPAPASRLRQLPSIDVSQVGLRAGSRLARSAPPLAVVTGMPAGLLPRVKAVRVGTDGVVDVTLRDGIRVIYGDATDVVAKGEALVAVLSWAEHHGITPEYVDVRASAAPALKPAGSPTVTVTPGP